MVHILVTQLSQCLFCSDDTLFVIFNGINNTIIGHATLHYIILSRNILSFTASIT